MHHKTIEQQKEQIKLSNNDNRVDKKKQTRQLRTVQKKFLKSTELNGIFFLKTTIKLNQLFINIHHLDSLFFGGKSLGVF